jgi:hypothetical protein
VVDFRPCPWAELAVLMTVFALGVVWDYRYCDFFVVADIALNYGICVTSPFCVACARH